MRRFLLGIVSILAGLAWPTVVAAQEADAPAWDDQAVAAAIAKARDYLWSQWKDGNWEEGIGSSGTSNSRYGGMTALCTYALLTAGERPQQERMKQTLNWLAKIDMEGTYARAFRASVWAQLGRESPYYSNLAGDLRWLISAMNSDGGYDYTPPNRQIVTGGESPGDNSNSQIAVLGVWAAARAGAEVPAAYWENVERHWRKCQLPDGGWTYHENGESYGSMTVAGLATMYICFDMLHRKEFLECRATSDYPPVTRGLAWLNANFSVNQNPRKGMAHYYYYLYGLERVGLASGYKLFANQDWYQAGARQLLATQGNGGSWYSPEETAFALIFLARGRNPVLFNKLQYEGSWNCRPRDLANLTTWMSHTFERTLNWQIIQSDSPVNQWHDAPILYISGATAPKFSDEDLDKLRRFVEEGGVIVSEAAGNRAAFTLAMRQYYARLFPQYEMSELSPTHPIFNQELQFDIRNHHGITAISNGVRLLALHVPSELSADYQLNATATGIDTFRLAANIYLYVTDKGILSPRGVSTWPASQPFAHEKALAVGVVKHAANWNPEPRAWERLSRLMARDHHMQVLLSPPLDFAELDAALWPVATVTGTTKLELDKPQREGLVRYMLAGGMLVVDAAGGSEAFAASADKLLSELLPGAKYEVLPPDHPLYNLPGMKIEKVTFRSAMRRLVADNPKPRLRGLFYHDRLVAVFSREDLTAGLVGYACWGLKGYQPQSSFELMRNAVVYGNNQAPMPSGVTGGKAAGTPPQNAGGQ